MKKSELQQALEIVKPGLANKEIIEQSTSFAFIKNRVVTYNDEISISHPVKDLTIKGAVKAEELYKLLQKINKEEIEIEIKESEVLLKAGKGKAGLRLQEKITLPLDEIPKIEEWQDLSETFTDQLQKVIWCTSNDMSQPIITCIHVREDGFIEATDRFRLMQTQGEELPFTFLLPASAAQQVIRMKPTQVALSEEWVHFTNEEGTILSCRIFEDANFPKLTQVIDGVNGTKLTFPKRIIDLVERAEIFGKAEFQTDGQISIDIQKGKIIVKGESDVGWWEEKEKMDYKGESIEFLMNPMLFKDILKETNVGEIDKQFIKFVGENWIFVGCLIPKEEK